MLINNKTIQKFGAIERRYEKLRFNKIGQVDVEYFQCLEHYTSENVIPGDVKWERAEPGLQWGDNWVTAWFRGDIKISQEHLGKKVYIRANTDGETLFFVDGKESGIFDKDHRVVMMTMDAQEKVYHVAFEAYAGNDNPGPDHDSYEVSVTPNCRTFTGIDVLVENPEVTGFVYDIKVLRKLMSALDDNSLRKNKILKGLVKVFETVYAIPTEVPEEFWLPKLREAREIMKGLLDAKNGSTAPFFGIVGHSHIDTAWLWPISETHRKCARTFSSVLNLMEQYEDFNFFQSAPYHTEVIKERYPDLYKRIEERVKEGKWEPNGAMYIEPDCNIPSGEALVRQLLVGQQSTREMFGYTSDILWLPDVFGYSAALPQILRGCNVNYFCTTKLSWNDTNKFPYDNFRWKGIDGTDVLSHFFTLHCWPDPKTMNDQWETVQHKDVQDRRLIAIGYGDGGGGPLQEMIEISDRVKDLEGCPKAEYVNASDFMKSIEEEVEDIPVWNGELYLELHRGTLTSIADIKRLNRKTEFALRDTELLCTMAKAKGEEYPKAKLTEIWKEFLVDQFHDILPGSSIPRVNDEAIESFNKLLGECEEVKGQALNNLVKTSDDNKENVMLFNTLSWDRNRDIVLDNAVKGYYPACEEIKSQWIENIDGEEKLVVSNISIPALGSKKLELAKCEKEASTCFNVNDNHIDTPYYEVKFDNLGRISYLYDKKNDRNVIRDGGALNTIWIGEDVPQYWGNWDVDEDQVLKMNVNDGLISREVVSQGELQLRLRSHYNLGRTSKMVQDIIFHADNGRIDFETKVDWSEKNTLLKAGFEIDVLCDKAKHEIQYGYVERGTHKNLFEDRARFEVCNHKWTDVSEENYGVALLNDSKYGISVLESDMRLTLIKSSLRPDPRGDEGTHYFTYSVLPHNGGFSVDSVTKPAYELNVPVTSMVTSNDAKEVESLVNMDSQNVIIESIKWAENNEGFVVRLYDAAKASNKVKLSFNVPVKEVIETNMLEEEKNQVVLENNTVKLRVKPFEIKTILCKM